MIIIVKKKGLLKIKNLSLKCVLGKGGVKKNKKEGDKSTPKGIFSLGFLYYRDDRIRNLKSNLKKKKIKRNMGWCNDSNQKKYNSEINLSSNLKGEKLFRTDHIYDLFIVIKHNFKPVKPGKGSAIFLHLTKNYKPTLGCIAISKVDFIQLLKIINKKTKIKII